MALVRKTQDTGQEHQTIHIKHQSEEKCYLSDSAAAASTLLMREVRGQWTV